MNIAIVHYHLQRGGVAQVIRHHLQALTLWPADKRPRVALVSSGRDPGWGGKFLDLVRELDVTPVVMPALDYGAADVSQASVLAQDLATRLSAAGFLAENTPVHIHNHQLGKNLGVTAMVRHLAARGYPLLLQVHDFAEDFRPERYADLRAAAANAGLTPAELAYPQAQHIHYAGLNARDAEILRSCGIAPERIHLFPNPALPIELTEDREAARRQFETEESLPRDIKFVVYPVRGIRRKNLGELLLWSILTGDAAVYAVTLPPLNPFEQLNFVHWKRVAEGLRLPCRLHWQAQRQWPLSTALLAADHVITTSVAEGFGMVFLESWLAGRQLLGRDLPDITSLFRASGLDLRTLSAELLVPWDLLDRERYVRLARKRFETALAPYGRAVDEDEFAGVIEERMRQPGVDFGLLPMRLQRLVIQRASESPVAKSELSTLNPQVRQVLEPADPLLIEQNAAVVREQYSIARCAEHQQVLYRRVAESPRGPISAAPRCEAILDAFLSFARFHPLRVERL